MYKILLVEDSEDFQKIVVRTLAHHQVVCVTDVDTALIELDKAHFDLILLDIQLPKKDGYSLLSELRSNPKHLPIPILCLTGKAGITDKVTAFSLGADDYIVKPFDPIEFRARIDAKLSNHRLNNDKTSVYTIGNLEIDQASHQVALVFNNEKREINLTQTEFKLLCCLTRHPDQVYTRDQLIASAWGENADVLDRVVDVHICSLRKKISPSLHSIKSVPGLGYKFSLEVSRKKSA